MPTEAQHNASFEILRYAQCWEDADVLLEAADIRPGDTCLSIASAGDNALAMLARDPARVIAVDLSAAQLACLELRVSAYRRLDHPALLELIGSVPSDHREQLYRRCRADLSASARAFWDAKPDAIARGIGSAGKFENYFAIFRNVIMPLVHSRSRIKRLLAGGELDQRLAFYRDYWDTWRWRELFKLFFSRRVMGRFGRDPAFFKYVDGSVSDRILARGKHALTQLNPADNPYLQWILTGRHTTTLPFALRSENFEIIRRNLDRLQWRRCAIEDMLDELGPGSVDRFNLSDIFEYMSPENFHALLARLWRAGRKGGRMVYWNMLAPRSRPPEMADRLLPLSDLAARLHFADKAFFYSALVVEEIAG